MHDRRWGAPILALTGTASNSVLIDIERELEFDQLDEGGIVSVDSFNRENLHFLPIHASAHEKQNALLDSMERIAVFHGTTADALLENPSVGGLVFCRVVNGAFGICGVSSTLRKALGSGSEATIRIFAGSKPADKCWPGTNSQWNEYKISTQRAFKSDVFPMLVATSSFGMGIDKPNIRYTVHYGIPGSLEALAQEAGRAGRVETEQAECAIVFTDEVLDAAKDYLATDLSTEQARTLSKAVQQHDQGDASRVIFLHFNSYPGVEEDIHATRSMIKTIIQAWKQVGCATQDSALVHVARPRSESQVNLQEQALYRLSLLGIVEDYTIDYARGFFAVHSRHIDPGEAAQHLLAYVQRYDAEERAVQVVSQAHQLIDEDMPSPYDHLVVSLSGFVYDVIERARRQALRNVVDVMRKCGEDGEKLRTELSLFLSSNIFSAAVTAIVNARTLDARQWWDVLDNVRNATLAKRLVAVCRRELESHPTHPGLHFLDGIGTAVTDEPDARRIAESLQVGLESFAQGYRGDPQATREIVEALVSRLRTNGTDVFEDVITYLVSHHRNEAVARAAYPFVMRTELRQACAVPWITSYTRMARTAVREVMGD